MNAHFSFFQKRIGGSKIFTNICSLHMKRHILNIISVIVIVIISQG